MSRSLEPLDRELLNKMMLHKLGSPVVTGNLSGTIFTRPIYRQKSLECIELFSITKVLLKLA